MYPGLPQRRLHRRKLHSCRTRDHQFTLTPKQACPKADQDCLRVGSKSDKAPTSTHYMLVQAGGAHGKRIVLFNYKSSRTVEALGAKASANMYSIVMTARVNGIEPYAYLCHLFEEFPKAKTAEQLEALLPWCAKATFDAAAAQTDAELAA